MGASTVDESETQSEMARSSIDHTANSMRPPSFDAGMGAGTGQAVKSAFDTSSLGRGNPLQLVQPTPVSGIPANTLNSSNMNQCRFCHPSALPMCAS